MSRILFGVRWISATALAAYLTFGGAIATQAEEGAWYIGANMPLMFIDDSEATSTTTVQQMPPLTIGATVKSEHDTGYKFGGVLGYHLDSNIRIEGELFLARAEIAQITNTAITLPGPLSSVRISDVALDPTGTAEQFGAMLNVWYDFEMDNDWTPYVGAGLGFIRVDQGDLDYDEGKLANAVLMALGQQQQLPPGLVPEPSATDSAFAYQLGAGVGYALSDTTTLHVGYRLQALNGLEFTGTNQAASVRAETDLRVHFLEIGIRQLF
ncbi:MAG: porin family protein [Rhodospirillaceae bacterium]|nr:porin family protein [Rhodospirillaceae bacterium]